MDDRAALSARQAAGKLHLGDLAVSLVGIALGVATLIIVMSVMSGFRDELLKSILGFNGHVTVQAQLRPLPDYRRGGGAAARRAGRGRAPRPSWTAR